jgi:hypothetical protein
MDDKDTPKPYGVAIEKELFHLDFPFLTVQSMEIDIILDRKLASFEFSHHFAAEALNRAFNILVTEFDVDLDRAMDKTLKMGQAIPLVIRRGVGRFCMDAGLAFYSFSITVHRNDIRHGFLKKGVIFLPKLDWLRFFSEVFFPFLNRPYPSIKAFKGRVELIRRFSHFEIP